LLFSPPWREAPFLLETKDKMCNAQPGKEAGSTGRRGAGERASGPGRRPAREKEIVLDKGKGVRISFAGRTKSATRPPALSVETSTPSRRGEMTESR
jgi:hypothetical protein